MDPTVFLPEFIANINNIRDNEFNKFNFQNNATLVAKKEQVINDPMEMKAFKHNLHKKASLDKLKPSNVGKKEYETTNIGENVDILNSDIFENSQTDTEVKMDIDSFDVDKKKYLINDFLHRKNIILEESCLKQIDDILNDETISLKKYLSISKLYNQIIKISFIKKLENGSYIIDTNLDKRQKSKKLFLK